MAVVLDGPRLVEAIGEGAPTRRAAPGPRPPATTRPDCRAGADGASDVAACACVEGPALRPAARRRRPPALTRREALLPEVQPPRLRPRPPPRHSLAPAPHPPSPRPWTPADPRPTPASAGLGRRPEAPRRRTRDAARRTCGQDAGGTVHIPEARPPPVPLIGPSPARRGPGGGGALWRGQGGVSIPSPTCTTRGAPASSLGAWAGCGAGRGRRP